jgi:hypothetical protein
MASTPTSKLEAINSILSYAGEAPITSLDYVADSVSATIANNVLNEVDRSFQTKGWSFNTDIDYTFVRDVVNNISVPSNAIRINVLESTYPTLKVVQRGTKLYDAKGKTYVFATNIVGEMVSLLDFDLLPESARNYVVIRSGRMFLSRTRPDETQAKITELDEQLAFANFLDYEVRSGPDTNFTKYSAELEALGINQAVFLSASVDDKLKLIQTSATNLTERQGRLYYQNRIENKTTSASDTYDTYRTQFNRLGMSEKEFLALDPLQKEEALVIAKGTSTTTDARATAFNTANIQTNLRKLGIKFSDFLGLSREQQQLMLDGASGLDNVIASTSVAVANFENASNRNKALNQVLRFINIPPVSSITASDTSYTADKLLSELEKIVQAEGWHFNTERDFTLTRDGNNQIDLSQVALPVLHVDADKYQDHKHNIVVRDNKLWDVNKSTSIFGSDVKVELVLQQTWDNIPVPIQRYIITRTAKELSATMGRADAVQALAVEENRAKVEATQYDEEQGDYNIFDSYDVARVLDRSIGYSNTTL